VAPFLFPRVGVEALDGFMLRIVIKLRVADIVASNRWIGWIRFLPGFSSTFSPSSAHCLNKPFSSVVQSPLGPAQ
jgi:hypothetical protein